MVAGAIGIGLVGVSLGFLGAGGTAIALPVLVYIVGLEAHRAVAFSILLVGGVSAYGAWLHSRKGLVRWRAAAAFAPSGIAGAMLGSQWSYRLSGRVLLLAFSSLLAVIAAKMMFEREADRGALKSPRWHWIAISGFGIGVLTGLLGVGGGFVVVPAMIYFAGLGMKEAVATSLVVIAVNSAAAFAGHAAHKPPEPGLALLLAVAALAGMTGGVKLAHHTHPRKIRHVFAIVLFCLAAFMFAKNL